jgi:hypothetical protein
MKTFITLLLISTTSFAAECKLIGTLESSQTLETTLGTQTYEDCRQLGRKALMENFYGLVTSEDKLTTATVKFRSEDGTKTEVITTGTADF